MEDRCRAGDVAPALAASFAFRPGLSAFLMQLLLILAIAAAATASDGAPNEPLTHGTLRLLVAVCGFGLVSAYAIAASQTTVRALQRDFAGRRRWLRRFRRLRALHTAMWLATTGILLYGLGWGQLIHCNWDLHDSFLIDDLLILFPVVVPVLIAWAAFHQVERATREGMSGSGSQRGSDARQWRGCVGLQVRCHLLLILVPVIGLLAVRDAVFLAAPVFAAGPHVWVVFVPPLVAVLVGFPLLVKVAWRAEPLARGALRAALQADNRKWRTPVRDVLVWPTGNWLVTAAVTGLIPAVRYVMLSDALIQRLADDEVRAIAAHEAGHVRHGHLRLRMMAIMGPIGLLVAGGQILTDALEPLPATWRVLGADHGGLVAPLVLLAIGAYALLVFGPYCRLLEHQADLFACQGLGHGGSVPVRPDTLMTTHGTDRFQTALERVSATGGSRHSAPTWLHPSLVQRTRFLHALVDRPPGQRRFARHMRRLDLAVTGGFIGALAGLLLALV